MAAILQYGRFCDLSIGTGSGAPNVSAACVGRVDPHNREQECETGEKAPLELKEALPSVL